MGWIDKGDLDDAALVAAVTAGDAQALATLFERYVSVVRAVVAQTLASTLDLDDVTHDTFLIVARRCGTLRDATLLRSFVVSVAIRVARNEHRKRTLRRWVGLDEVPAGRLTVTPDELTSERVRCAQRAIEALGLEGRVAFVLRRVEGYELVEAAAIAGCSLATFKRRFARAEARFEALCRADPALCEFVEGGAK